MITLYHVINRIHTFIFYPEICKGIRGRAFITCFLVNMAGTSFILSTYGKTFEASTIARYFRGKFVFKKLTAVIGCIPKFLLELF